MMEILDPESNIMFFAEKVSNKSYLDWCMVNILFDQRTMIYDILTANEASFIHNFVQINWTYVMY